MKFKSDGRYDDEQQNLLKQKEQLQEEITTVLSETHQLENELERMEKDTQDAGESVTHFLSFSLCLWIVSCVVAAHYDWKTVFCHTSPMTTHLVQNLHCFKGQLHLDVNKPALF